MLHGLTCCTRAPTACVRVPLRPCMQVAGGRMLGPDQPVILHLLDIEPAKAALEGVKLELLDAAFPLLHGELLSRPALRCSKTPEARCNGLSARPVLHCHVRRHCHGCER